MKSKITVNKKFTISPIDRRIYSGFIEQGGRAIYEGLYQPDHASADGDGFRTDVIELFRELDMPLTRYPGGNFVSVYNWEDGVGPKEQRPARLELAWQALEPNQFGTDEFVRWCKKANTEPMMAVNLGTRGPKEAQELLEYCNFPGGTALSDRRRANGAEEPYGIKVWCLGNEMDGPWQLGQRSAEDYGRVSREAAKMMKCMDDSIELIVCGSSHIGMPTLGEWDETVLDYTFDHVDYISIHQYFGNPCNMTPGYLARAEAMEKYINNIVACCDAVATRKKSNKKIMLSFDEWNVWYHSHGDRNRSPKWTVSRPLLEDIYNTEDALLVGMMMMTLINHADRVKIACLAQGVNVIAPIMTSKDGKAWKQTIFDPFVYTSKYGRGTALQAIVESDNYETEFQTLPHEKPEKVAAPYLYCSVVDNTEAGEVVIFACNRNLEEAMELETLLENFVPKSVIEAVTLHHADLKAVNSEENEQVKAEPLAGGAVSGNTVTIKLPAASWNMIRVKY